MKILGVEMEYQLGKARDEIMTFPAWQAEPDYIYQFGCKEVAYLNCYNLFNRGHKYMTLKEFNDKIKVNNGFRYLQLMDLYNNDLARVKKDCLGSESFIVRDVIHEILGIKSEVEIPTTQKPYMESLTDYYICRTQFQKTGHYSMVYNSGLKYFDSYDGIIKEPKGNILNLYKITF